MLMREIEHDVVALDWRTSKAHSVNGNKGQNIAINTSSLSKRPAAASSGIHVLGGQMDPVVKQFIPAKYLAGVAALRRLSEEEQEIEDHCGGSIISPQGDGEGIVNHDSGSSGDRDGEDADAHGSDIHYHHDERSSSVSINEIDLVIHDDASVDALLHGEVVVTEMNSHSQTNSEDDYHPSTSYVLDDSNLAHDDETYISDTQEIADADEGIHDDDHNDDSVPIICEETIDMIVPEITVDDVAINDDARQLHNFQLIENTLFGHIDEVIANAYELSYSDTILMKLSQFRQAFEMIIQSIRHKHKQRDFTDMDSDSGSISEILSEKLAKLLSILYKVLSNLMNFPTHDKYRSINKSSAIYQNHIQIYDGMLELLAIVDFQSDNVGGDGVHVDTNSRKELVLKRSTDQALLYLLCSVLQHMLEIVVSR